MRVLITGAGLIGCFTALDLTMQNCEVCVLDENPDFSYLHAVVGQRLNTICAAVEDLPRLKQLLAGKCFDAVIHTAGLLKGAINGDAWKAFQVNVAGTAAIAELSRYVHAKKFIHISSLAVYGKPESLYDHTKIMGEQWLSVVSTVARQDLVILRPAGVYGPGLFRGGSWMGPVLQRFLVEVLTRPGDEVLIQSDDFQTNDCLYVKDLAHAIRLVLNRPEWESGPNVLDIGSGRVTTLHDLERALQVFRPGTTLRSDPCYEGRCASADRTTPLNIEAARQTVGYEPRYAEISDGLADYAQELFRLGLLPPRATNPLKLRGYGNKGIPRSLKHSISLMRRCQ